MWQFKLWQFVTCQFVVWQRWGSLWCDSFLLWHVFLWGRTGTSSLPGILRPTAIFVQCQMSLFIVVVVPVVVNIFTMTYKPSRALWVIELLPPLLLPLWLLLLRHPTPHCHHNCVVTSTTKPILPLQPKPRIWQYHHCSHPILPPGPSTDIPPSCIATAVIPLLYCCQLPPFQIHPLPELLLPMTPHWSVKIMIFPIQLKVLVMEKSIKRAIEQNKMIRK